MSCWPFSGHAAAVAAALRCTRPLLAYNKSSGYRWSPIPKPPPPHYDRLYGVHSVLNTLRVAAAAAEAQQRAAAATADAAVSGSTDPLTSSSSTPPPAAAALPTSTGFGRASAAASHASSALHPHRAHLACLYVRDFSAEESEKGQHQQQQRKKRVIPRQYTAVRCIAALAKSLEVPVRFVPRRELVQLCGERRNQNVVLEASRYVPRAVHSLAEIWNGEEEDATTPLSSTSSVPPAAEQLVLFLDHIIDPTNIGGILRTAFFFGVDHVVLSRDCAGCTATVSRTSTGFLEHLHVCQAAVPTEDFLKASREAWSTVAAEAPETRLDIIASMVVPASAKQPTPVCNTAAAEELAENVPLSAVPPPPPASAEDCEISNSSSGRPKRALPHLRVLLLGNEDAGLRLELLPLCTHVAHVHSPRQTRLRQLRGSREVVVEKKTAALAPAATSDADSCGDDESGAAAAHDGVSAKRTWTELEKRAHELQRLARIREKEVSLNVNTATAALLAALAAVEGQAELPTGRLGMVEVRPL